VSEAPLLVKPARETSANEAPRALHRPWVVAFDSPHTSLKAASKGTLQVAPYPCPADVVCVWGLSQPARSFAWLSAYDEAAVIPYT
jgi:hypothetical protein